MDNETTGSVPTTAGNSSWDQGSNAAAAGLMVAGVAVLAGTYWAVRRGVDKRIARQIKKHLKKDDD